MEIRGRCVNEGKGVVLAVQATRAATAKETQRDHGKMVIRPLYQKRPIGEKSVAASEVRPGLVLIGTRGRKR